MDTARPTGVTQLTLIWVNHQVNTRAVGVDHIPPWGPESGRPNGKSFEVCVGGGGAAQNTTFEKSGGSG